MLDLKTFETQRFFDDLTRSGMSRSEVHIGPILASRIYLFQPSAPVLRDTRQEMTLAQSRKPQLLFNTNVHNPDWAKHPAAARRQP